LRSKSIIIPRSTLISWRWSAYWEPNAIQTISTFHRNVVQFNYQKTKFIDKLSERTTEQSSVVDVW